MAKRHPRNKPAAPNDDLRSLLSRMAITPAHYQFLLHHLNTRARCTLCGTYPSATQGLCVVEPERSELWGGIRGKWRIIAFALCAPCNALPNCGLRVEARFQANLAGSRN